MRNPPSTLESLKETKHEFDAEFLGVNLHTNPFLPERWLIVVSGNSMVIRSAEGQIWKLRRRDEYSEWKVCE